MARCVCRGGVGGEGLGDEEDIFLGKNLKIPRARFFFRFLRVQGSFSSTRKYCGSSKAAKVWVTRKT